MRIAFSIIFVVLILVLSFCAIVSFKSRKPNGKSVALLVASLIPPVVGNLLIIASIYESLSLIGCYFYFLGMNLVMGATINFTFDYCGINKHKNVIKTVLYTVLILDGIQLLLNIFTHHAFGFENIEVYGSVYYRFIPYWGQTIHRVVDYTILGGVLITFIVKTIISPKVYSERYLVILFAMLAVAAWQTFYIVSRTPVDVSMTGFGVFGVLVFLLALFYRPLRLLDRMLAALASRMSEALFFFDTTGRCIWVNERANNLLHLDEDNLPNASDLLKEKFGQFEKEGDDWKRNCIIGSGDSLKSYIIERHAVIDHKNRVVGHYLSIRDNSIEEKNLQRETYNATHDSLTKALNRAGYDSVMKEVELSKTFLILIDVDSFKATNDEHGHTIGDQVLVRIVDCITEHFRDEDFVCRIGGDEFAVVISDADKTTPTLVEKRIDAINEELRKEFNDLPTASISAGGAFGKDAENSYELFNNADHALYETKFNGKCGFTSFKNR